MIICHFWIIIKERLRGVRDIGFIHIQSTCCQDFGCFISDLKPTAKFILQEKNIYLQKMTTYFRIF